VTKARRKRRWLMWCSAAGLCLTLAAAAFSEFAALSWREETGSGPPNRVLLYRSSVLVVCRVGKDEKLDWLGRELFKPGWSIERSLPANAFRRQWTPEASRSSAMSAERWFVVVPLWTPAVILGAGMWWGLRGRWSGAGVCRHCGYDVSGLANGVCPECGGAT
jgi:hypothetical protein